MVRTFGCKNKESYELCVEEHYVRETVCVCVLVDWISTLNSCLFMSPCNAHLFMYPSSLTPSESFSWYHLEAEETPLYISGVTTCYAIVTSFGWESSSMTQGQQERVTVISSEVRLTWRQARWIHNQNTSFIFSESLSHLWRRLGYFVIREIT